MLQSIFTFIDWIKWLTKGKPHVKYAGYNCGCCGKWIKKKIRIPTYQSLGQWHDTWGLCDECANCDIDLSGSVAKRANPPMELDTE